MRFIKIYKNKYNFLMQLKCYELTNILLAGNFFFWGGGRGEREEEMSFN